MEAIPEETIHQLSHRNTMTPSFMEEHRDDRSRDGRHVVGRSCHLRYMPQDGGVLQQPQRNDPKDAMHSFIR